MKTAFSTIKVLLVIFFLVSSHFSSAQTNSKDFLIGTTYDFSYYSNLPNYSGFGLTLEKIVGNNFGLEATFSAGKNNLQMGAASVAAPLVLAYIALTPKDSQNLFKDFLAKVIIIACLAEHINYHIDISKNMQLIPYVSWLRIRNLHYIKNNIPTKSSFTSGAVGLKLSMINKKKFFVNVYSEIGKLYIPPKSTVIQTGLNFGYIFKH